MSLNYPLTFCTSSLRLLSSYIKICLMSKICPPFTAFPGSRGRAFFAWRQKWHSKINIFLSFYVFIYFCFVFQNQEDGRNERDSTLSRNRVVRDWYEKEMDQTSNLHEFWGTLCLIFNYSHWLMNWTGYSINLSMRLRALSKLAEIVGLLWLLLIKKPLKKAVNNIQSSFLQF